MSKEGTTKVLAVLAVALLLTTAAGTALMTEEENETDAVVISTLAVSLVISCLAIALAAETAYILTHTGQSDTNEAVVRGYEAEAVASSIFNNLGFYSNALDNYSQIWKLTSEHHIRMAELAASELWSKDAEFSASDILEMSGVYINSQTMMINSTAQINAMWDLMTTSLTDWNATDLYKDKMGLEVSWSGGSISSKESFTFDVGTVADSVTDGQNKVYISSDSTIWADTASKITGSDGKTWTLVKGFNEMSDLPSFSSDVFSLQSGVTYVGDMMYVLDKGAATLKSGAVATCGSTTKVISYYDGKVLVDGKQSDYLKLSIHPDGAESQTREITAILSDYSELMNTVFWTMNSAATSAASVWSIFDKAGAASTYLTTLSVPSVYDNVNINAAQKEIITVLAMEQLASYWQENGGEINTGNYNLSDSMSLFVRGDITSVTGEVLYKNAIFTPFFYQDTTLKTGSNTLNRQAIAAIWSADGENLSGWSGITDSSKASLVVLEKGYVLSVAEMENAGTAKTTVDLTVSKISVIEASELEKIKLDATQGNDLDRVIMLVMVLAGILALISGWRSGSYITLIIGGVLIIVGLMFSGSIAGLLEGWLGWRIDLG